MTAPTYQTTYSTYRQSWGIGPRSGNGFFQFGFRTEQDAIEWWNARRNRPAPITKHSQRITQEREQ